MLRVSPLMRKTLDALAAQGFLGRTAQEVMITLAVRELERISERDVYKEVAQIMSAPADK